MDMRKLGLVAAAIGMVTVLGPRVSSAAEFDWKFFTYFVTNSTPTAINRAFAEDVFESSGGRLKIEVFAAGELPFKPSDVLKAVATNKVQMGDAAVGFIAGDVPELNVFSLPFVCTSFSGFNQTIPAIAPIINSQLSTRFGVRTMMNWTMPPQNIWTVDQVSSLDGLKGTKVRAWNPLQVEMLRKLDAAPARNELLPENRTVT